MPYNDKKNWVKPGDSIQKALDKADEGDTPPLLPARKFPQEFRGIRIRTLMEWYPKLHTVAEREGVYNVVLYEPGRALPKFVNTTLYSHWKRCKDVPVEEFKRFDDRLYSEFMAARPRNIGIVYAHVR